MRNDQRLIPFLGGLVIGGVGGAAAEGNKQYYNNSYYPPYYYNQPYYNNYPYQQYNNYYPYAYNQQSLPVNSSQYPQNSNMQYSYQYQYQTDAIVPGKLLEEDPIPIVIKADSRSLNDISYVPKYM